FGVHAFGDEGRHRAVQVTDSGGERVRVACGGADDLGQVALLVGELSGDVHALAGDLHPGSAGGRHPIQVLFGGVDLPVQLFQGTGDRGDVGLLDPERLPQRLEIFQVFGEFVDRDRRFGGGVGDRGDRGQIGRAHV